MLLLRKKGRKIIIGLWRFRKMSNMVFFGVGFLCGVGFGSVLIPVLSRVWLKKPHNDGFVEVKVSKNEKFK